MDKQHQRKVAIVGAGAVGSTFAYALAQSGLANQIVLIDQNKDLVQGQVLDLLHGDPFFPTVSIREGESADYHDAELIVITAGSAQKAGETRLQLLQRNAKIIRSIMDDINQQNPTGVVLVVCNPVDIMTFVALQSTNIEPNRIIGSGTVLDSARLKQKLSQFCDVDVHNVHAYMLGEHGDSEFAAWSMANIAGTPIDEFFSLHQPQSDWHQIKQKIEEDVRNSAYHIIDYKGATYYAVGLALVRIAGAVLRGEKSVLTVSTLLNGQYGLDNISISVPCIISNSGVAKVIEHTLPENELNSLHASAQTLKSAISKLNY